VIDVAATDPGAAARPAPLASARTPTAAWRRQNHRLHACSDRFEKGRVLLPTNAPWLDEYVMELVGFSGTKYDDQVDSTTQALDYMREHYVLTTYLKALVTLAQG
jgi:hypothetical protein